MRTYGCSVLDVACFFLAKGQLEHMDMTHLKVQKLVYYAQGFVLACTGSRLFDDIIQAWPYGPVCPTLYHAFKVFASCNIRMAQPELAMRDHGLAPVAPILDNVWEVFGRYDGWQLVEFTHQEQPWIDAMKQGRNTEISCDAMEQYFSQFVVGRK